ncbi:ABC transporter ATP-binding protein [Microbispora sp. NBC_01189]|uniref:ABC transporter ATP-binding protein n=1 Tax=unclassified Microbispora TaxID=2614687 RepID=UPI002E0F4EED|nr:ABC transporter ATP-binding protein [Microbispora sp. NBC_01189]
MSSRQSPTPHAVSLSGVRKVYGTGDNSVVALESVTVSFERRTLTAVMGPSGSGKTTLLHCAAGLDEPTEGSVQLDGQEINGLSETALTLLRRDKVGFIFQAFNLMPALTAEQNVVLPLRLAGRKIDKARARDVLTQVGLGDRAGHRPSELSGGQQQRVAIARALVASPAVIFADEPTGSLDSRTAREILELLRESVRLYDQTVVMVTHDPVAASYADRVVFLVDGSVVTEMANPTAESVAEQLTRLGEWAKQRSVARAEGGR